MSASEYQPFFNDVQTIYSSSPDNIADINLSFICNTVREPATQILLLNTPDRYTSTLEGNQAVIRLVI